MGSNVSEIIRISEPIKAHWAKEKGLMLDKLLGSDPYKETHRKEMIEWSDKVRAEKPDFFCKIAYEKGDKIYILLDNSFDSVFLQHENLLLLLVTYAE